MLLLDWLKRRHTRPEPHTMGSLWERPFDVLRQRWHEVPAGDSRLATPQLLELPDNELKELWESVRVTATTGAAFEVRGWYHVLYKDVLQGKRVMDVGSGLGIDGITFALHGARITFVDIVQSNITLLKRLCELLDVTEVDFCYMDDISSLSALPTDYDAIWCQGSLINAPFDIMQAEAQELLRHLPVGGRWIELAYPQARWERDGRLPFDRWGERTDGPGTPWVEWYDLSKLRALLEPAKFEVVLYTEFHNSDFNWFDLMRRA